MKKIILTFAILFLLASPALSDDVYTWTDEKGVIRFSDHPPEGVEAYQKIEGTLSEPQKDDDMRPGLQKMINEVKQQNREADQRKAEEAAAKKEKAALAAQAEKESRIQAERDQLQKQIDDLNNRALSPTFSQGMRDNLIKEIRKKIDALGQ